MHIYLVQHGQARPKEIDPDRHLTEKGTSNVEKVAAFLKQSKPSVGTVWHSGKARAAQTAKILATGLLVGQGVIQKDGLAPNDPVEPVKEKLQQLQEDFVIVGHLPFLSKLASSLLGVDELTEVIAFQPGGVVCIGRDGKDRRWKVDWIIIPELLP